MMDVIRSHSGRWVIIHAGKEVAQDFATEVEAWSWADHNIDDQVFDGPNEFTRTPIIYRHMGQT